MNRSLLALCFCAALAAPSSVLAVPLQVAHQGQIQDADGPVTDTLEFVFALFDAASDGDEVWSETRDIDVVDGNYAVLLGSVTAIDSVLFTEPALWLQITIEGGEALLPRQPIASAPYAIVAGTAENVSGGTVDASSIAVNGLSVVNSTGQWVGPAGSIDWSAITGAPADADTLGGLSCADGDRAVWNDGLSLWECGSATVTLDRLDTAAATTGQILTYDGADAAWASTPPAITQSDVYVVPGVTPSTCYTSLAYCNDANDVLLGGWCAYQQGAGGSWVSAQGPLDSTSPTCPVYDDFRYFTGLGAGPLGWGCNGASGVNGPAWAICLAVP